MEKYLHLKENSLEQKTDSSLINSYDRQTSGVQVSGTLLDTLTKHGHGDVYDYLNTHRLNSVNNCIVLSPSNHYFFEEEDLKDTEMVIDIHNLTKKKDVRSFLSSLYANMPDGCYFTGCFETPSAKFSGNPDYHRYLFEYEDKQGNNRNGSDVILSAIDRLINQLNGSLSEKNLKGKDAEVLFVSTGFRVEDITEANGKIYFAVAKTSGYKKNLSLS